MPQTIDKAAIAKELGAMPIDERARIASELGATPISSQLTSGETLVGSTPSQIASGIAKGAGRQTAKTALAGVQWLQNILGLPVSPIPPSLEPATPIESIGGQIPQIALPVAAGIATGGASVPVQAAVGGLASGLSAASSDASPATTQVAAALGAAAPAIQGGGLVRSLRKGAEERVASAISPSGMKEKDALSKVIAEITKRRPIASSSEGLLKQFTKKADQANLAFDALLSKGPSLLNVANVAKNIDTVIDSLKIGGQFVTPEAQAAAQQLAQVQNEIRSLASGPIPGAAKMADARALKQSYDSIIKGTAQNFNRTLPEASRAEAAKEGFFKIREGMIQQNPALKQAGKEAQIAITPRDILARQEVRTIAGGMGKVGDIVELGGLAAAITTGRIEPAIGAAALSALRHILASTPRKLISAGIRTTLANAIENGNVKVATTLAAQVPAIVEKWAELQSDMAQIQ